MAYEHRFIFGLKHGMHARPASALAGALREFRADVAIVKEAGGARADARSVLAVIGLDIHQGDAVRIVAEGEDAAGALGALRMIIDGGLCETEGESAAKIDGQARLPVMLRRLAVKHASGKGVSSGVAQGAAAIIGLSSQQERVPSGSAKDERARVASAIEATRAELEARAEREGRGLRRDLLEAQAAMIADRSLRSGIEEFIGGGASACEAVEKAAEGLAARLRQAANPYVRDRAIDVQDVCEQLCERLGGGKAAARLERESVVFAEVLTAGRLMSMERELVRGLVLGRVGETSHTVILARSMGIPAIVGVANAAEAAREGEQVIVDGSGGFVVTEITGAVSRFYERHNSARDRRRMRLVSVGSGEAKTRDGVRIEIGANASSAADVGAAIRDGAEGIGLFRTELLFLDRTKAPTEEEQFDAHAAAVRAAAGKTVIFRTLDIGGDKPAPYLRRRHEENPFLGQRGIRLYDAEPALVRAQVRALVRASALGPVKVMAPMVTTVGEAKWFAEQVGAAQAELGVEGIAFDRTMPIGVMVEVPALAMAMDRLCEVVDFASIGTNDLSQYAAAADRGNPAVAPLCDPKEPAFLRLLDVIVRGARAGGRWVGVCGEMAGDVRNLPLLVGLGVDEISAASGEVLALKAALGRVDSAACRELWTRALACRDAGEVGALLRSMSRPSDSTGALIPEAVAFDSESATSKEEAIKEAVDALFVAGRTDEPATLEEAVWAREETYSTGVGHGFAIPHARTNAVHEPSIAAVRLRTPVEWGSLDGEPVSMVFLLVVPESNGDGEHLKILARLARRLMHEEFRARLLGATDGGSLAATLQQELSGPG